MRGARVASVLAAALALGFPGSGCAERSSEVKMSEDRNRAVRIECRLAKAEAAFAYEEDVKLRVDVTNGGDAPLRIPYLSQSDRVEIAVRRTDGKDARKAATLVPRPGIAVLPQEQELAAGATATYRLLVQAYAGPLAPGSWEVRLSVDSEPLTWSSDWIPFVVGSRALAEARVVPSSTHGAAYANLLWTDSASDPPSLLWRSYALGHEGPRTGFTAEIDRVSKGPVDPWLGAGPPGTASVIGWLVRLADEGLVLAKLDEERVVARHEVDLPGALRLVGPPLIDPDPTTDETGVEVVALTESAGKEPRMVALFYAPDGRETKRAEIAVGAPPTHAAVTRGADGRRWVAWSSPSSGGGEAIRLRGWGPAGFDGAERRVEVEGEVLGLDLTAAGGDPVVAAYVWADPRTADRSPFAGGGLVELAWEPKDGEPTRRGLALPARPTKVDVVFGDDGSARVLARDPDRAWFADAAGGPELLALPDGAGVSILFVDPDGTARVVVDEPQRGWILLAPR